jgi:biopolymer transport protein ExbB/TolQ
VENLNAENVNFILKAFDHGGPAMYFIAAVGVMVVCLLLERFFSLRALTVDKIDFNENLFGMILRGEIRQAIAYCDAKPIPLTNTLKAGLVQVLNKRPDEEVQVAMDAVVLRESPRLEGWTGFLAVFGNIATLIGLLGTIVGLIRSFAGVAAADASQKAIELSRGISEALNCTAFGLMVAIIAITAYGYFQIRVSRATNDMIESSLSLMNLVVSNRDKLKDI